MSNTAYYCCGVRMDDANRKRPVVGDRYAQRFMDRRGLEIYAPFRSETMPNISNISRCRIIDDWIAAAIDASASTTIVTIGAGFDTRPYRLPGGRWYELDEPELIEYKNDKLPVGECESPLTRIPIRFDRESLLEKLAGIGAGAEPLVVMEGVIMYLGPGALENSLAQIRQGFPRHKLLCDLMNRRFFERFSGSVHAKLVAAGGSFSERPERPADDFLRRDYRLAAVESMFERAIETGVLWDELRMPSWIARLLFRSVLRDLGGYAAHRFEFG
ncbi:MAG: class I SAM-dependent methyltransferase [Gammaproteobacteria bacterium]